MRGYYLKQAEKNLPTLYSENITIKRTAQELGNGQEIVIDLGNYYVGYLSFVLGYTNMYPDAPVRLSVKFCENKEELDYDFSSYKGGLSSSWLQEEVIHIDYVGKYEMPRRYAARYIKIKVLYTPRVITLTNFVFRAVTSANIDILEKCRFNDLELQKIDFVSVNTLKNCMHRIFEDGPKRDRRLWIGDLRLEALVNYVTFNQLNIVRRCLYLFSASSPNQSGFLPAYIYENPEFVSGYWHLEDYALLFVVSLCDYYLHTRDEKTFFDIYPVAKQQMEAAHNTRDENGILIPAKGCEIFIDWNERLKKITAFNGVYLYTLNILSETLTVLHNADSAIFQDRYKHAKESSLKYLYNEKENNFLNAYDDNQMSVHSIVWMILGGVLEGDRGWNILQSTLQNDCAEKPITPYMHHYLVEAMIKLGKKDKAIEHIKQFWGLMVRQGADTFYEVFVPNHPDISPYGDKIMNSKCHAWSCTPAYFLRKIIKGNKD